MRIKIVLCWMVLIILLFTCIGCSKDEDTDLVVDKTAVFISNLDGSNQEKIIDNETISFITYAFHDQKIAYIDNSGLYSMNFDGSDIKKISGELDLSPSFPPRLTNDGSIIYFSAVDGRSNNFDIYMYDFNLEELTAVYSNNSTDCYGIDISPDESKLIFVERYQSYLSISEFDLSNLVHEVEISNQSILQLLGYPQYKNNDEFYYVMQTDESTKIKLYNEINGYSEDIYTSTYFLSCKISPERQKLVFRTLDHLELLIDDMDKYTISQGYNPFVGNQTIAYCNTDNYLSYESEIILFDISTQSEVGMIEGAFLPTMNSENTHIIYVGVYNNKEKEYLLN